MGYCFDTLQTLGASSLNSIFYLCLETVGLRRLIVLFLFLALESPAILPFCVLSMRLLLVHSVAVAPPQIPPARRAMWPPNSMMIYLVRRLDSDDRGTLATLGARLVQY